MNGEDAPRGNSAGKDAARMDNGLHATRYVPLTDVDAVTGQALLTVLRRARIPAYLAANGSEVATPPQRLFVASEERGDARTIVAAAIRALADDVSRTNDAATNDVATTDAGSVAEAGADAAPDAAPAAGSEPGPAADPLSEVDTDAEFEALVADWHVDTVAAVRSAERDLTQEDADWRSRLSEPRATDEVWLDDDHYVPPAPPPLPRLARMTVLAFVVLVASVLMLAFGTRIGFPDNLSLVLGIGGLVVAAVMFFSRVRDHQRDEDDDGSAI